MQFRLHWTILEANYIYLTCDVFNLEDPRIRVSREPRSSGRDFMVIFYQFRPTQ